MSEGNKHTANQRGARRKFKRKIESWGMDPEEVRLCVEQYRQNQMAKTNGKIPMDAPMCTRASYVYLLKKNNNGNTRGAAVLKLGDDYDHRIDDRGYKPSRVDSVLTGAARATGNAARSIKSGKAMTKFQYDRA